MSSRAPDEIMRLDCMGSAHPFRLSFLRILLRRMAREKWRFDVPLKRLDQNGFGVMVYTATGPSRSYSLVCFSHDLAPEHRTDRVIATAWDATFALVDGIPTPDDIARLAGNIPKQEAGRVTAGEITVSRANRSVRVFDHVVEALAAGRQPAEEQVLPVGYLMRTTAVYGSGKLGAADYESLADRPEFAAPFQAEMLTVYLIREFTLDLAEHIAAARAPATAVKLAPALRRTFGVGNSTGLGMAPYLVNHPVLLHHWMQVRETALARVRAVPQAEQTIAAAFARALDHAGATLARWHTPDPVQTARIAGLTLDLQAIRRHVAEGALGRPAPWDGLYRWGAEHLTLEGRELLASLMIEPYGALVDGLEQGYRADEAQHGRIDGTQSVAATAAGLEAHYAWAFAFDFGDPRQSARFWYASAEKLEPRLGERYEEPGSELEFPLAVARDMQRLHAALRQRPPAEPLGRFLMSHPDHRNAARRLAIAGRCAYSEIRDNIVSAAMRPIDMLRFKLAFFGATRFDPRSDRWVRITLFQDAPFRDDIAACMSL